MSKQCLSIEQMLHLQELGLDTSKASAYWHRVVRLNTDKVVTDWFVSFNKHTPCLAAMKVESINTFTLQDILNLLPDKIDRCYMLYMWERLRYWAIAYVDKENLGIYKFFSDTNLIECAYKMLCWCIENGYIETNK